MTWSRRLPGDALFWTFRFLVITAPSCGQSQGALDDSPLAVDDVTCKSPFDGLTCSWQQQSPDVSYTFTSTALLYSGSKTHSCEPVHCVEMCSCTVPGTAAFPYMNHSILINATTSTGSTLTQFYLVLDDTIASPASVKYLSTTVQNSHSIAVTWKRPDGFVWYNIYYRLRYWNQWDLMEKVVEVDDCQHELGGLEAYTSYTINVQAVVPASRYSGSDSSLTSRTLQAEPKGSPAILTFRQGNIADDEQHRDVIIYLQPIPIREQHGVITEYNINVTSLDGDNSSTSHSAPGTNSSVVIGGLEKTTSYIISIRGHNIAGRSPAAYMDLPASHQAPSIIADVVGETSSDGTSVTFIWPLLSPHVEQLMLMYCYAPTEGSHCQSGVDFLLVSTNESSVTTRTMGAGYRYGLAVTESGYSSGLAADWACVYKTDGMPADPLVEISSQTETSITLAIQTMPCDTSANSRQGLTLHHHVTWGSQDCGHGLTRLLNATTSELTLHDLDSGRDYHICIKAIGRLHNSTTVSHVAQTKSPTSLVVVLLPMLLGFLALLTVPVSFVVYRACVNYKEKMAIKVDVPMYHKDILKVMGTNGVGLGVEQNEYEEVKPHWKMVRYPSMTSYSSPEKDPGDWAPAGDSGYSSSQPQDSHQSTGYSGVIGDYCQVVSV